MFQLKISKIQALILETIGKLGDGRGENKFTLDGGVIDRKCARSRGFECNKN